MVGTNGAISILRPSSVCFTYKNNFIVKIIMEKQGIDYSVLVVLVVFHALLFNYFNYKIIFVGKRH